MSISGVSSYSSLRIGGLASGLDTDSIVEQLMEIEQLKIDKLEAQKTTFEWQQEEYQTIIGKLNTFKDNQYNILDSEKNILSSSSYKTSTLSNTEDNASKYLSVVASGDAVNGTYTINKIEQLATKASVTSSSALVDKIVSDTDYSVGPVLVNGLDFNISLDGVNREISFSQDYATLSDLETFLQTEVDSIFGVGRIDVGIDSGKYLTFDADNSLVQLTQGTNDALTVLGFSSSDQNRLNTGMSLENAFSETSEIVEFSINDVDFSFSKTDTIKSIIDEVNSSDAKVTMTYNSLDDTLSLTTDSTGQSAIIEIDNVSGNFFGASSYINITDSTIQNGQDAIFYLNDDSLSNPIHRSNNSFSIDSIMYQLKETTTDPISITLEDNVDDAFDKIVSFVDEYNEIIDYLYTETSEKQYRDYTPLSDDQKESMSDDDIEMWEEKAKSGLLRSDSTIRGIADKLRTAAISAIDNLDGLYDIGITSMNYSENGKLQINETALKQALTENVSDVMAVFTQSSDIEYDPDMSSADRSTRYNESGFARRIYDILQDNIRTTRSDDGLKGILLEKAGLDGDATAFDNLFKDRIDDMDDRIDDAIERMNTTEDRYWQQFSALEEAINRLNSQSAWLSSQFA